MKRYKKIREKLQKRLKIVEKKKADLLDLISRMESEIIHVINPEIERIESEIKIIEKQEWRVSDECNGKFV